MVTRLQSLLAFRIDRLFDGVASWWASANADDFGALALATVVCVWFITRYYAD
jgi:hypothetical protein